MGYAERSPFEQAALRYCAPRGIPFTRFTEGREGPPEWTREDVQAALEWQAWEDGKCPGCGQPAAESMAHEDEAPAYEADVRRCHACKVAAINVREASKDGDAAALYTLIHKAV